MKLPPRSISLALLALLGSLATEAADSHYPRQLTPDVVPVGQVVDYVASPDRNWIVYVAQPQDGDPVDLFSVRLADGQVIRLNEELSSFSEISELTISPDSSLVLFGADRAGGEEDEDELLALPIEGGATLSLSGPPAPGGTVLPGFQISPDGQHAVYLARQGRAGPAELLSVPLLGGPPVKLNGRLPPGGEVYAGFEISADGSAVVYRADQEGGEGIGLFSTPVAGGTPLQLSFDFARIGAVHSGFRVTRDSSRVVYAASEEGAAANLFSVPLGGGESVQLNDPLSEESAIKSWQVSPTGSAVVFQVDQTELFTVPTGGGTSEAISFPSAQSMVASFFFSPDGLRLIIRAEEVANEVELFSASALGGGAIKLSGPLVAGGSVLSAKLTPDGTTVVYLADAETDEKPELYAVPVSGGPLRKLNDALIEGGGVRSFQVTEDGMGVVYLADGVAIGIGELQIGVGELQIGIGELQYAPLGGGPIQRISGPLVARGEVKSFTLISNGSVFYLADADVFEVIELYQGDLQGAAPVKLSKPIMLAGEAELNRWQLSPDGRHLVYHYEVDGVSDLYSVLVAGGNPVKLNRADQTVATEFSQVPVWISPDSSRVLFRATTPNDTLCSVPIGGGEIFEFGTTSYPLLSLDSERILFVDADNLFTAPIEGGALVQLSTERNIVDSVGWAQVTPDSSRVALTVDVDPGEGTNYHLYAMPIGGGAAVKLNEALGTGEKLHEFQISPDGAHFVYTVRREADQRVELFMVPSEGGAVRKLNGSLVAGGSVYKFEHSPDGSRVIYEADAELEYSRELYSVSTIEPNANPVKLSSYNAVDQNGDVYWRISSNGSRVVFKRTFSPDLYSIPIGGGEAVLLNPLNKPAWGHFEIAHDSSRALYLVREGVNIVQVNSVPIDGGSSVALNPELISGGDIQGITVGRDGFVYYLADQEIDGLWGAYRVPVSGGPVRKICEAFSLGAVGVQEGSFQLSAIGGEAVFAFPPHPVPGVRRQMFAWKDHADWSAGGGSWFVGANWHLGVAPGAQTEVNISAPAVVTLSTTGAAAMAGSLTLGGADGGLSVLEFHDALLEVAAGATILPGGSLRGSGWFIVGVHPLCLPRGTTIQARGGDRFVVQSGPVTNEGRVEAFGVPSDPAALQFVGQFHNLAGSGALFAGDADLEFVGGLFNGGALSFGTGTNHIAGDLTNEPGGVIVVSGGATAIFYGDVHNASVINVSASGGTQSTAVFFGSLSGNGISGAGQVFIEGDARPGFSPGTMSFGGDLSYGPGAWLEIELGGTESGKSYDQLAVAGHLQLDGVLQISLLEGFVPAAGMEFDLWDAASVSGQFMWMELPELPVGLRWDASALSSEGSLRVVPVAIGYDQFASGYGLTGGALDDEEGDGLTNLEEWVLGLHPNFDDARNWTPRISREQGKSQYQFEMRDLLGADIVVEIESSKTLAPSDWLVLARRVGSEPWKVQERGVTVESSAVRTGSQLVTLSHQNPSSRRFYRLRITLLP